MALFKNAELWHIRVIPSKPNRKFNRDNPTWEVQVRTTDPDQRKQWEADGLQLKAVVPDDGGKPFWKATIQKRILKKDGTNAEPVEVKGGGLQDLDPAIIGNGSIGHVRVFQYDYPQDTGGTGTDNVLMGIQLTKLKKYTAKPRDDDFAEEEMEIIEEDDEEDHEGEVEVGEEAEEGEEVSEEKTAAPAPKKKFD